MSATYWNGFGICPACKAQPGEPCRDQRRSPRPSEDNVRREIKRAHRFRPWTGFKVAS
jgi:hypothetical protein